MNQPSFERAFCTTREAAEILGVSVGTVQIWVENGLLQAWKTSGGHRRIMRDSLDRLVRRKPGGAAQDGTTPVDVGASSASAPMVQARAPRRMSIVVVEDDASLLALYEARMKRWPMQPEITGVDNAFSALLTVGRHTPDLLIADLNMPGMDGFAMLRLLRKTPELNATHIVVVSGMPADEIAARGGVPDGIDILPKPIPFDRLLAIVSAQVDSRGFMRASP